MKRFITAAFVMAFVGAAFGQGRNFAFNPDWNGWVDGQYGGNPVGVSAQTTINVPPFLYVQGVLATVIDVTGWGNGGAEMADGGDQYIKVWHNYDLKLVPTGFGVGLPPSITLGYDFDLVGLAGGNQGVDLIWTSPQDMNNMPTFFSPVDPIATGGHFTLLLRKKIDVTTALKATGGVTQTYADQAAVTISAY